MHKYLFALVCSIALFSMTSCGSDEPNEVLPSKENAMSLKVDGVLFQPENVVAKSYGLGYEYVIEGVTDRGTSDVEILSVFLDSYEEGTYELGRDNMNGISTQYSSALSSTAIYQDLSGSVTIDRYDESTKEVEGRFDFICTLFGDTISISEGVFDVIHE